MNIPCPLVVGTAFGKVTEADAIPARVVIVLAFPSKFCSVIVKVVAVAPLETLFISIVVESDNPFSPPLCKVAPASLVSIDDMLYDLPAFGPNLVVAMDIN